MSSKQLTGLDRRAVLRALAALPAASVLSACGLLRRDLNPVCSTAPAVSSPLGELTIDAHCHVFNGSDLQVEQFLKLIVARQAGPLGVGARAIAPFLQDIALATAPSGKSELDALKSLANALKTCSTPTHSAQIQSLRNAAYQTGRARLTNAVNQPNSGVKAFAAVGPSGVVTDDDAARQSLVNLIGRLPEDVSSYEAQKRGGDLTVESLSLQSAKGVLDFILRNFQYRYVNIYDYLGLYNQPGARVIDLMVPSMVDYDFGLAKGRATSTPLTTQVQVMRQIAILTGGRVHAMAPFDPMKQVAFERGLMGGADSLAFVRDAVRVQGCLGVKLYPPMGFKAYGNADLDRDRPTFWAQGWLADWMRSPGLGAAMDGALDRLYTWCVDEGVPVMAHTALSNGVSDSFQNLAGADGWQEALSKYPALRVNFGHFGDSSLVESGTLTKAESFTKLMHASAGATGQFAYADAGYFVEVLKKEPALETLLQQLYDEPGGADGVPLANRFMYGTDWEMTVQEGDVGPYLSRFVDVMNQLEARPAVKAQGVSNVRENFFGFNAAAWAGLRRGERTRTRLETFYSVTGVAPPDWAAKVDQGPGRH